jgi:SP family myo-inositol transporter-like MFS transporter 13
MPSVSVPVHAGMHWHHDACPGGRGLGLLALFGLIAYLIFFAPGMGCVTVLRARCVRCCGAVALRRSLLLRWRAVVSPMPWTVNSEIFPLHARSAGVGITTAVNWIANLIVSMTFLTLQEAISPSGAFWLYAAVSAAGWLFFFFRLPETKNRTMEDIQSVFAGGNGAQ